MANRRKKIVVYLYNRLYDPVIQSNIYLYLKELAVKQADVYKLAIVTYEDPQIPATPEQFAEATSFFQDNNVDWYPLTWHKGTSLAEKAKDIVAGYALLLRLRFKGYRYLITLASIAGAYGYLYSLFSGYRLYLYQYEPHSEYAVDNHIWASDSKQFKLLNSLEKKSALHAHVISTGTKHMMQRLKEWNVKAQVFQIRSVVNEQLFVFHEPGRKEIRENLGLANEAPLFLYAGKFGDLYYYDEIPQTLSILLDAFPGSKAVIVTLSNMEEIKALFAKYNLTGEQVFITTSAYTDMPKWLSASDFALVAVPPAPSKKFISNIKVGEYLCCGLPYLIPKGISEDDSFALENRVGVVVNDFSTASIQKAIPDIKVLLSESKESLRDRCREKGIEYRGFAFMNKTFKKAIQALVSN